MFTSFPVSPPKPAASLAPANHSLHVATTPGTAGVDKHRYAINVGHGQVEVSFANVAFWISRLHGHVERRVTSFVVQLPEKGDLTIAVNGKRTAKIVRETLA